MEDRAETEIRDAGQGPRDSVAVVARAWHCSERTVYRRIASGELAASFVAGRYLIPRSEWVQKLHAKRESSRAA